MAKLTVNQRLQIKVQELQLAVACLVQKAGGRVVILASEAHAGAQLGVTSKAIPGAVEFTIVPPPALIAAKPTEH